MGPGRVAPVDSTAIPMASDVGTTLRQRICCSGAKLMDFIFMLTRRDRTVEDSLHLVELIRPLGIRHIGFKDVGVSRDVLARLSDSIRATGAAVYLELVSTTLADCLRSAEIGRELGVDGLLGGTHVDAILDLLAGSNICYFPFPGRPTGHPTSLHGTAAEVEEHCRAFAALGCPGVDLLAYRAMEADPLDLVAASRRGIGSNGYLITAGSISSPDQIRALKGAGADAFTIGSAVFEGSFSPSKGSTLSQLEDILQTCADLS